MRKGRQFLAVTGVGCLIASVLGLAWAAHTRILGDEGKPVPWSLALADYMGFWMGWGLLSGVVACLVQRYPITPHRKRNALVHLACAAVAAPLHSLFCYACATVVVHNVTHQMAVGGMKLSLGQCLLFFYPRGIVYYFLIVAITHALIYYRQFEERSRVAAVLESQLAQAKLHLLKMQLHPHFLFNTLNSISALLREDVEQADLMIERLGDFLRLTLDHSTTQEVSLREELEFLSCYLSIEQIRLQDRLTSVVDIEPQVLDARVPSLILQPIVENAIRHGIAPRAAQGRLEIGAHARRSVLVLTVRDNGPGLAAGTNGKNGKGMGLEITRHRLERLYGAEQRLELANAPEGGLVVTLEIPLVPSMALQVADDSNPDRG